MYEQELDTAKRAVSRAATIIHNYYQRDIQVTRKNDDSPVTRADTEAEIAIRQTLALDFPNYGFFGEETGGEINPDGFTWLVDPLDGTKSFVLKAARAASGMQAARSWTRLLYGT